MNRRDFMKGIGVLLSFFGMWKGEKKSVPVPAEPCPLLEVIRLRRSDAEWFDQSATWVRESSGTLILNRCPLKEEAKQVQSYFLFPLEQGFVRKSVSVSEDMTGTVWTWQIRDEEVQSQRS